MRYAIGVRHWHLADMAKLPAHVCFRDVSGHALRRSNMRQKFAGIRPRPSKSCIKLRVNLWVQKKPIHNDLIFKGHFRFWEDTPSATFVWGPFSRPALTA